ncbi:MAG: GAF domain-containing protein [Candidatus Omnitrophica bacterium]|nr:GAF domain-containing protein [Candidatus Omnitrophota bacterium]
MIVFNLFTISGLLTGITCSFLAVILLIFGRVKEVKLTRLWMIFNTVVALWDFSLFFIGQATNSLVAFDRWRLAHVPGLLIAPLFLHVIYVFCGIQRRKFLVFSYLAALTYIVLDSFNLLSYTTQLIFGAFYYIKPIGPQYTAFATLWLYIIAHSLFVLFRFYRTASGHKKNQALYFLIVMLVGFSGGSTHFITAIAFSKGIQIYPFGQLGVALYCIVATYAILKYRLMDVRIFVSRAAAFLISYPFFLSIPFIFAYRTQVELHSLMGANWWLVPAGLIIFFSSLSPIAYSQLKIRMEEKLLADQKRYQKLLLQAASGMATEHNLNKLSKLIVYIVKRAVKVEFATIFIDDKNDGVYRMKAFRDTQREAPFANVTFLYEHSFIRYLAKHSEPCIYEELPEEIRASLGAFSSAALVIPSAVQDELLGFVILGAKLNKQPYSDDDVNVFKILSHQAALAIENSLFLEETKQAQEKIFAAEKLASIGGMADGVAHQIKNRLNQFSVASGELKYEIKDYLAKHPAITKNNKDLKKTLKYLTEIADSLINNVKRTDGIVKGILNFARVEETSTFFSQFSLKEVIDLSAELLKIKHEIFEAPLDIKLGSSDTVYGIKSQITEAVYNLLDNAYEATQEKRALMTKEGRDGFNPLIKIKLTHKAGVNLLEISDNGIGMRDEDKAKVFAPFFTTKSSYKSGTGIGVYVVKRMIEENHKGKVHFSSTYMEGTKFFVELPKK